MYTVPFRDGTFTPGDDLIPGNTTSNTPVGFDFVPAAGPDLARLKSLVYADFGLVSDFWTPQQQDAVIRAFETGRMAFTNTVTAVRNLTVPVAMAKHVGILDPGKDDQVIIDTGLKFSLVAAYMPALGLQVATKIMELGSILNGADPRLFTQPSGSGGKGTRIAKRSSAKRAPKPPEGNATAAAT